MKGSSDGKEPTCQCRRPGVDPRVGKTPWRRERQPAPAFLPGASHGRGAGGLHKGGTRLSDSHAAFRADPVVSGLPDRPCGQGRRGQEEAPRPLSGLRVPPPLRLSRGRRRKASWLAVSAASQAAPSRSHWLKLLKSSALGVQEPRLQILAWPRASVGLGELSFSQVAWLLL